MASGTTEGIVLISSMGNRDPIYNQTKQVDGDYRKAKCTGTRTFFVIYDKVGFASDSKSMVVDSEKEVNMGVRIRSLQGYDKKGLVLFAHPNYCGQGALFTQDDPNIIDQFPSSSEGVSALVVHKGRWALYSEPNYMGTKIAIDGKDEFGPGTCIQYGGFDAVKSVKQL